MAKKKGFEPISQKRIDESIKLVAKASAPLGDVRRMESADRRRIKKMRKGGAASIPTIVEICTRYGLQVPGVSFVDVTSKIAHAQRLSQLERVVSVFLRDIRDELLVANGDAWTAASAGYAMLRGAAKAEPGIDTELAKVHAVFSHRPQKAAVAKTPAPSTSATTTNGTDATHGTPA